MKDSVMLRPSSESAVRDSNIELYRIISMLLIVAHHYVVNSGLTDAGGPVYSNIWSFSSQFLLLFGAFGKIGTNCFVLISGYFMCKSNITAKKFAKLLCELMFYKIIISTVFWLTGYTPFTVKSLLNAVVPFRSVALNFTGTYLLFFLCIPFLNVLVQNLNELQHIRLLLLCSFIYILLGSIPFFNVVMNYVSWYIVLYVIASYIRLYPKKIFDNTRVWGSAACCCFLLSMLSVVVCSWLYTKTDNIEVYYFVSDCNKLLAVLTGVSSFIFFKNVKIKPSKVINTIASATFGVLLIHANSETMRQWLWKDLCCNVDVYHAAWMPLHAIGCVAAIYAVCTCIDLLRIRLIEKPFFMLWDRYYPGWYEKFRNAEAKVLRKLKIGEAEE